jgi:hypothetical protein
MGETPAEIAEGAEDLLEWGNADSSELFSATALVCWKRNFLNISPKGRD